MKKQITLLPPSMPNHIFIEGIEHTGAFKSTIGVSQLNDKEAEEYGQLMKETFIKHHKNKNRMKKDSGKESFTEVLTKARMGGVIGLFLLLPLFSFSQSVYSEFDFKKKKETSVITSPNRNVVAHIEKTDTSTVYMIADTMETIKALYQVNYMNTRIITVNKFKRRNKLK